jgi:hypothetical protein
MEIDPNEKILTSDYSESRRKTEPSSGGTFGKIYEELIEASYETDVRSDETQAITNVPDLQMNAFQSEGEMPVVERAERLLDLLSEYQQKLANPVFTLRDISPFIDDFKADNKRLVSSVNSLAEGDELKNILNQVIVTASVEIIKFDRGDYVNP